MSYHVCDSIPIKCSICGQIYYLGKIHFCGSLAHLCPNTSPIQSESYPHTYSVYNGGNDEPYIAKKLQERVLNMSDEEKIELTKKCLGVLLRSSKGDVNKEDCFVVIEAFKKLVEIQEEWQYRALKAEAERDVYQGILDKIFDAMAEYTTPEPARWDIVTEKVKEGWAKSIEVEVR